MNTMKSVGLLAWLMFIIGAPTNSTVAGASGGQSLELNIQMVPGIWISGGNGAVRIEYTTNLDQTSGWTLLATVQATNSPCFYSDASATNSAKRFYRALGEQAPTNPNPDHLVWIPSGSFTMGSPSTEQDRNSQEGPQTQVTISRGFWMSKHETTQEDYLAAIGSNPSADSTDLTRPVEQVNWYDATNYCGNLTILERAAGRLPSGYAYRLPTEAEWEYCCRAGSTTRFGYGDDPDYTQLGEYAWLYSNSGGTTHPVGGRRPNAWGLYDMHGNVWEWCLDWRGTYPGGSVTDTTGPNTGSERVVRGGGWNNFGWLCRTAYRYSYSPESKNNNLGFRPVLAPTE